MGQRVCGALELAAGAAIAISRGGGGFEFLMVRIAEARVAKWCCCQGRQGDQMFVAIEVANSVRESAQMML